MCLLAEMQRGFEWISLHLEAALNLLRAEGGESDWSTALIE